MGGERSRPHSREVTVESIVRLDDKPELFRNLAGEGATWCRAIIEHREGGQPWESSAEGREGQEGKCGVGGIRWSWIRGRGKGCRVEPGWEGHILEVEERRGRRRRECRAGGGLYTAGREVASTLQGWEVALLSSVQLEFRVT